MRLTMFQVPQTHQLDTSSHQQAKDCYIKISPLHHKQLGEGGGGGGGGRTKYALTKIYIGKKKNRRRKKKRKHVTHKFLHWFALTDSTEQPRKRKATC